MLSIAYIRTQGCEMSIAFERKFAHLISDLAHGTLTGWVIDLREAHLTKTHLHKLADVMIDNFSVVKNITEIDLSYTNLSSLPEDIFRDCDALRILNLDNSKLKTLPNLPDRPFALQDFFASNNHLHKIKPHYFDNCISLKALYLNNTNLEEAPRLDDSLSLAWLHLNANPIHKFPKKFFAHLPHLDTLFIQDTKLKELPDLTPCRKLHEVWVDDIKIPDKHISATAQVIVCKTEQ